MRTIKLISLTAMAALIAAALVGNSSAMAEGSTALCKVDQTPCAAENLITTVHEESVGKATLLSSALNVECNVLFSGSATPGTPTTVTGKFTYSSCNNSCTVTEQSASSTISVLG